MKSASIPKMSLPTAVIMPIIEIRGIINSSSFTFELATSSISNGRWKPSNVKEKDGDEECWKYFVLKEPQFLHNSFYITAISSWQAVCRNMSVLQLSSCTFQSLLCATVAGFLWSRLSDLQSPLPDVLAGFPPHCSSFQACLCFLLGPFFFFVNRVLIWYIFQSCFLR